MKRLDLTPERDPAEVKVNSIKKAETVDMPVRRFKEVKI